MNKTVGVLGGGQLGRMFAEAANRLNIQVKFLDTENSPAKQITNHTDHITGSFKDPKAIERLAASVDVVTVEIEHVDTEVLERVEKAGIPVEPSWRTIRVIQDKYAQKEHLAEHDVQTAKSVALQEATVEELKHASVELGLPLMLKSRREAYDGRGNFPVKSEGDFEAAIAALGRNGGLYAEEWAEFRMELAVMVVKTKNGVLAYPTTETIHTSDSICKLTYTPARNVSANISEQAQELAKKAVRSLWGKGVFGVEMFLLKDGRLLINEIAPRPHNSGHYTIEACPMSQYDAHLHAILDMSVSQESLRLREPAIMVNILGGETKDSHIKVAEKADAFFDATGVHLYGKGEARKGRKMGHVTITAPTMAGAERMVQPLIEFIDNGNQADVSAGSGSAEETQKPLVAVIMGSDSDLPHLLPGIRLLDDFQIPYTTRITSAHRTPHWMAEFAESAADQGLKVLIAAAGGAAHLPGMAASHTLLPVIGVPIKPRLGDGFDSIVSMTNMPGGVPVATVGLNNALNAALLATRILSLNDASLKEKLAGWISNNERMVREKDKKLEEMGARTYAEKVLGV